MSDKFSEPNQITKSPVQNAEVEPAGPEKPLGAILIATILGLTILAVWFGTYLISALRYSP